MSLFPNAVLRSFSVQVLVLACFVGSAAAESHLHSAAELRPLLSQAHRAVAACAAAATGCDAGSSPADVTVDGDSQRPAGFAVHFDWLRTALKDAATAPSAERTDAMHNAEQHLNALDGSLRAQDASSPVAFDHAHATVAAVLARKEFQGAAPPTAWDRFKARIYRMIANLFAGVDALGNTAPWVFRLIEWVLFLGAAVGLLYFLQRAFARQRLRVELGKDAPRASGWARESTKWAELARARAAEGDFRDAIHCLYWSAIVLLEGRRLWRHDASRTPREYVRLLAAGSAQREGLRTLTAAFEQCWYGLRDANAQDYANAETALAQLADAQAAAPRASSLPERA